MNEDYKTGDTKIIGFSDEEIDQITNGSLVDIFGTDILFGMTGKVINKNTNEIVSNQITPMIMLINQSTKGFIDELRKHVDGPDPRFGQEFDRPVNYYNKDTSAKEIAINYRSY